MKMRAVVGAILTAVAAFWAAPAAHAQPIPINLSVGDFTYQFADPVTGLPITTLNIPTVGASAKVAVYLLQTGGTPVNVIQQLGAEGLGVRLNYASPAGIVRVPSATGANIIGRPPPAFNPNSVNSDYDFIQRFGSTSTSDTSQSAAITDNLVDPADPLPFPGSEDPLGNKLRMLIGTFNLTGLATGIESLTAVDPFAGVQTTSGPNPVINGARNDGTNGPLPGNGNQGEVQIDQLLAQNLAVPVIPTLTVTVGVPEPSSMALGSLTLVGLAAWRRRRSVATVAA